MQCCHAVAESGNCSSFDSNLSIRRLQHGNQVGNLQRGEDQSWLHCGPEDSSTWRPSGISHSETLVQMYSQWFTQKRLRISQRDFLEPRALLLRFGWLEALLKSVSCTHFIDTVFVYLQCVSLTKPLSVTLEVKLRKLEVTVCAMPTCASHFYRK